MIANGECGSTVISKYLSAKHLSCVKEEQEWGKSWKIFWVDLF